MNINYCKDCNKVIHRQATRCRSCNTKFLFAEGKLDCSGEKSNFYIDGRKSKQYYCIEVYCNHKVSGVNKRCKSCAMKERHRIGTLNSKGKNNPNYNNHKLQGKNNPMYGVHRMGEESPGFKHGRSIKDYVCSKCGEGISYQSACYGAFLCRSCAQRINNSGEGNPMYGVPSPMTGKHHTKESKRKQSLAMGGTGIPFENALYPKKFHLIKEQIRERDNHICRMCGKKQENCRRKLDVHHIDYNKKNCESDNLITLCAKCHMKTNINRDFWETVFTKQSMEVQNA